MTARSVPRVGVHFRYNSLVIHIRGNSCPEKLFCLFALCALLPCVQALSQSGIIIERNQTMKTRDGVTLKADIYRPAGDGKFPVLLQRTPYDKRNGEDFALEAIAHGFMVVVQDVRGRYTSEGEWYPFKHEIDDGYDTVEWAAALPHSNGKVGMFGGSYVGATQMLAAIAIRRTWPESAPWSPPPTITKTGPTRAAPSSSGSTSRGPPASRRTR